MSREYVYSTRGTCSSKIKIQIDDENNKIENVGFHGGCDGNTKGLSSLLRGMDIDEAIDRLKGIDCRGRGTSCPDQLAIALQESKKSN